MNSTIHLLAIITLSTLVVTGCTQQPSASSPAPSQQEAVQADIDHGKELSIVTTFPPLYAHVANVIDANDTVTNLVPPGTSVHTRQPKPSDVVAMEEADMIITNGLGLEEFLEDYLINLQKKGVMIVDTSAGVELMEFDKGEHNEDVRTEFLPSSEDEHDEHEGEHDEHEGEHDEHDDEHNEHEGEHNEHEGEHNEHEGEHNEHEDEHHHEGPDPHIWLDTTNARIQVENIVTSLIEADPTQASIYNKQANDYSIALEQLSNDIRSSITDTDIQPFIVFHDAYQYFLEEFNLDDMQIGYVQESHNDNPSQQEIAILIETITTNSVATIYTEPQFNPSIVKSLEQETGITVKQLDPIGSNIDKDGYIQMMTNLANAFVH